MDVIDNFITTYLDEGPQWACLKDRAIDICVAGLERAGLMGNVTGRVKSDASLRAKLAKRASLKPYCDREAIMDDQLDFVGLRIALYFPDQKRSATRMLTEIFQYEATRPFERDWKPREPELYQNQFGHYAADHVWVSLREEDRGTGGKYSNHRFEVQVRSVLMDAWAGISHDLTYKALSGDPTVTELRLLDALKGHVEVGEMLLEQLHRVHRQRIETENEPFNTSRELGEILIDAVPDSLISMASMGDLDVLHRGMRAMNKNTPRAFRELLRELELKTKLHDDLQEWQHKFHPIPATVSFYLLERSLSKLPSGKEDLLEMLRAMGKRRYHLSLSPYFKPLVWLSQELLQLLEASSASLSSSRIRKYARIWLVWFHSHLSRYLGDEKYWQTLYLLKFRTQPPSDPGVDLFAELCALNLAPGGPEDASESSGHEYEACDAEVIVDMAISAYAIDSQAWIQATHDVGKAFPSARGRFLHSADMVCWLLGLSEKDVLVDFLRIMKDYVGYTSSIIDGDDNFNRGILFGRWTVAFREKIDTLAQKSDHPPSSRLFPEKSAGLSILDAKCAALYQYEV